MADNKKCSSKQIESEEQDEYNVKWFVQSELSKAGIKSDSTNKDKTTGNTSIGGTYASDNSKILSKSKEKIKFPNKKLKEELEIRKIWLAELEKEIKNLELMNETLLEDIKLFEENTLKATTTKVNNVKLQIIKLEMKRIETKITKIRQKRIELTDQLKTFKRSKFCTNIEESPLEVTSTKGNKKLKEELESSWTILAELEENGKNLELMYKTLREELNFFKDFEENTLKATTTKDLRNEIINDLASSSNPRKESFRKKSIFFTKEQKENPEIKNLGSEKNFEKHREAVISSFNKLAVTNLSEEQLTTVDQIITNIESIPNINLKNIRKLCELQNEEIVNLRKFFQSFKFVFHDLEDLKLVAEFVWKYRLNAEFNHPMFEDQDEKLVEQSNVPITRLDDEKVHSKKSVSSKEETEKTSASKDNSNASSADQKNSTSCFLRNETSPDPKNAFAKVEKLTEPYYTPPYNLEENRWEGQLGKGGYGNVYVATKKKTKNEKHLVAVKIPKNNDLCPKAKYRFDHEMKVLELVKKEYDLNRRKKGLTHIICMHESVFVGEDRRAFVLKYCQRGSLEDLSEPLWKNKDFLAPSALLQFFKQIASGLNFLHRHYVIHNDLTLTNILIDKNFNIKITDFGGSTIIEGERLVGDVQENKYYKPKKRVEFNQKPKPSHDIYSYGVCLYTAINGYEDTNYFYESCRNDVRHKLFEKVYLKYHVLKNEKSLSDSANAVEVSGEVDEDNELQAQILYRLYEIFSSCCLVDDKKRNTANELFDDLEMFIDEVVTGETLLDINLEVEKQFTMKSFKYSQEWVDILQTV